MTITEWMKKYQITCEQLGRIINRDTTRAWRIARNGALPNKKEAIAIFNASNGNVDGNDLYSIGKIK